MDKKELQEQYESMIKEAEKLKEKIDSTPDKKAERQKPTLGELYFYVDTAGDIIPTYWANTSCDLYRFSVGNCFETFDEVFDYKQNLLTKQQLKDLALELNDGFEVDWRDSLQAKFSIWLDNEQNTLISIDSRCIQILGDIYCLDGNFLEVAKLRIGEEKLIKLIKSGV